MSYVTAEVTSRDSSAHSVCLKARVRSHLSRAPGFMCVPVHSCTLGFSLVLAGLVFVG